MEIRLAQKQDIQSINKLLRQVLSVHHKIRPDIFKEGTKKYTDDELKELLKNPQTPVFVAVEQEVLGYVFCQLIETKASNLLHPVKTLYIDDLCVDEDKRGKGIGRALYEVALDFAKRENCYNLTLNVWAGNDSAVQFYEKCGLGTQKTVMEKII